MNTQIEVPPTFWDKRLSCIYANIPEKYGNAEDLNSELKRIFRIAEDIVIFATNFINCFISTINNSNLLIMIEVYKTNVRTKTQSKKVMKLLKKTFSESNINFDLQDCDKILRVKGITHSNTKKVINYLIQLGFKCEILN